MLISVVSIMVLLGTTSRTVRTTTPQGILHSPLCITDLPVDTIEKTEYHKEDNHDDDAHKDQYTK